MGRGERDPKGDAEWTPQDESWVLKGLAASTDWKRSESFRDFFGMMNTEYIINLSVFVVV